MAINSVMNIGYQGMQSSYNQIEKAAEKIADSRLVDITRETSVDIIPNADSANIVTQSAATTGVAAQPAERAAEQFVAPGNTQENIIDPIVAMKTQQHVFDASAKIVKTGDEMLGTIMDIKA